MVSLIFKSNTAGQKRTKEDQRKRLLNYTHYGFASETQKLKSKHELVSAVPPLIGLSSDRLFVL